MSSEFVRISREDWMAWIERIPDHSIIERPNQEMMVDFPIKDAQENDLCLSVRVYTSLVGESTRGLGEDAIRCVLFDMISERPLGKTKRIHRTEGRTTVWERLDERFSDLREKIEEVTFCPKCGSAMVLRTPKQGQTWKPFFGCSSFPDCKGSRPESKRGEGIAERLELVARAKEFEEASNDDERSEENQVGVLPESNGRSGEGIQVSTESILEDSDLDIQESDGDVAVEFAPTNNFSLIEYPFEKFQPIQGALAQVIEERDFNKNIICAAPTGAGKTVLAEMGIAKAHEMGGKAIYLSPFKALTQEKYDEWREGIFKDKKISIVTGDYTLTESRIEELRKADIILLTTEMLDSRTRRMKAEKNTWLYDVAVVVVDEMHIITMEQRGDKTEAGLMRFFGINHEAILVGISATMPNVDELGDWASVLTNRKTLVLKSNWRPVNLNIHAIPYAGRRYWDQEASKMDLTLRTIDEYPEDKFLVFVHSKKSGYALLRELRDRGITADFHSADLELKKRLEIEKSFKDRGNGIRILVSTSTTAWGVNLPARRCIIFGVTRGLSPVDPMDIIQEIGRSGRPGLDPEGDAYILCPPDEMDYWGDIVNNCPPIRSQMLHEDVLGFHICAELGTRPMTTNQIKDWYQRSLAKYQGMDLEDDFVEQILTELTRIGAIEFDPAWNNYKLTGLGRVSAWLYYDPWTVADWYVNFRVYFERENELGTLTKEEGMAICLANVPSYDMGYVLRDWESDISRLANKACRVFPKFRAGCGVMMLALDAMLSDGEVPKDLNTFYRQISWDMSRIVQALKLIDSQHGLWGRQEWFEVLRLRVQYGVPEELVGLCKIKGIGGVRAKKLADSGIKSLDDFLQKPKVARNILGKVFESAWDSAQELKEKE